MTITAKDFASKAAVAFVAVAMIFTMFAPSAKAQSSEDLQTMINTLLAQIAALQAQVGGGAQTAVGTSSVCPFTWTRDLNNGATGADVMKLQQFLNSNPDTRVAAAGAGSVGAETSYYGPATAAAVSKMQVMYRAEILTPGGLVNPTGYFGPSSRAKANALCVAAPVVVVPGTTPGTTTPGTSAELKGDAGSISVTQTSTDVETDVNTGDSENVLGFKVEADGSDVEVTNVKVTVNYTGSNSKSNRLDRYFDSFDVVFNGDVVGSADASDFTRDSAGEYSKTISLKNAIVRQGDKETFHVAAVAADSLDSNNSGATWSVNATNFRYVDAQGAIISDSTTGITATGFNVVLLSQSTDVKIKLSLSSDTPSASAVRVSPNSSGDLVTLVSFRVKAEGTDATFDQVKFNIASTGSNVSTMVSEFRLMKGSKTLATIDAVDEATTTLSLDDTETVDMDDTETYTLVAKMNKNTFVGSSLQAKIASASNLNVEDNNGDLIAVARLQGSAIGNVQTFRGDGLFADANTITQETKSTGGNSSQQYGEFKFTMDVTADGDDYYFGSTSAAITASLLKDGTPVSTSTSIVTISSSATKTSAGDYVIYDGQTKTVTVVYTMAPGHGVGAYKVELSVLKNGVNGAVTGSNINLTPANDFTSGSVSIVQ